MMRPYVSCAIVVMCGYGLVCYRASYANYGSRLYRDAWVICANVIQSRLCDAIQLPAICGAILWAVAIRVAWLVGNKKGHDC